MSGEDPSSVKWMQTETPRFRIIYPAGEDSLARVYGSWLEKAGTAVSWSSGMSIGQNYRSRMPVILHSFNTVANASVTWAPKRMDMYTVQDPYSPTPIKWEKLLAFHEGRHASQMQAGAGGRNKPMHYIVGEIFAGAMAGLYPGPVFLEGDAVVTETALTESGRGRQASFLSYMMPAFDSGDFRDWWQWSYGSHKYYSPDYYRSGYMMISGMRVFFDEPLFTKNYFDRVQGRGLFFNLQKTIRQASGMGLDKTFRTIEDCYAISWNKDALERGPFMPSAQVSPTPWRHTAYSGSAMDGESSIWSRMSGITTPRSLVKLGRDGSIVEKRPFSSSSSDLFPDRANGRIWWSETIPHWRWSLAGDSRIRFVKTSSPKKIHDLTRKGRYFNPAPSPDGTLLSVTEYPTSGGSRILLLDSSNGEATFSVQAPDSLQFTESAWVEGRLFAAGLSDGGMGIYEIDFSAKPGSRIKNLLGPEPVELASLRSQGNRLTFVCDRTGVNELYLLDPCSGTLVQATSTRYGIGAPFFSPAADTLYYSSLAPSDAPEAYKQGWMIYSTPVKDLPMKEVSFCDRHEYPVAEALSRQEKALAGDAWNEVFDASGTSFSEPRKFNKFLPRIHSWAPVYFNYDNVEETSSDEYYKTASLGATVMFQNLTSNGYAFLGYGAHKDDEEEGKWRHSAHFKYLYTGFIPVLEFSADLGDRQAKTIGRIQQQDRTKNSMSVFTSSQPADKPYFEGFFRVYVPVNLSSGGFSRGIIPQVKYKFTNDSFKDGILLREIVEEKGKRIMHETGFLNEGDYSRLSSLDFSIRGYVIREKASSLVYPRYGIGAEAGLHTRPGHSDSFSNTAYLYLYGYLPGILQDQGIKLSATFGADLGGGPYSYPENPASFIPRGFVDTNIRSIGNACSPSKFKLTFDYAIPLLNIDWSGLCPLAYVKNMEVTPFLDYSYHKFNYFEDFHINMKGVRQEILTSAGADIAVNLGNFLWLPYDTRIGFRYAYNSWKNIEQFPVSGLSHHYFGGIFSVSM